MYEGRSLIIPGRVFKGTVFLGNCTSGALNMSKLNSGTIGLFSEVLSVVKIQDLK